MRHCLWLACAWLAFCVSAQAADGPAAAGPLARGAGDGAVPAWTIDAATPAGWTRDCCLYARAIGVDAVLYRGEWTGEPQRVMVLNVWPRKLPTLAAELEADRKRFLQRDPAAKAGDFPLRHRAMQCEVAVYQGTDRIDDVVAFCDPGQATGVRLSWSMALAHDDPQRRALLDDFMRVVVASRYARGPAPPVHGG